MERSPLLSVIVPVYNTGRLLSRCMAALTKQTYPSLEILLIDDGSTDDSGSLCDAYAAEQENVRVLHKANGGLGYARNSGLEMARGQYVTFLDSDDYVHEDMYRLLMASLLEEGADAAFCDFCFLRKNGQEVPGESLLPAGKYPAKEMLLAMLGAMPEEKKDFAFDMSACKGVYSLKTIREAGIAFRSEREVLCEDLFFHLDFLKQADCVCYIKRNLYYYCENEGSLTHRYIPGRLEKEKTMFQRVCQEAEDILQDQTALRWHRLFLGRIRSAISQYVFYKNDGSLSQRLQGIRAIAGDGLVQSVLASYPVGKLPVKLRIFCMCLKGKWALGMYLLIALNR